MNKNLENYDSVQVADSYPPPTIGDHENINFSENAPCGLLTLTPDGGIFYINLIGAELIGAEENLSERPTFIEYIDPDYHGAMVQALQNTVATGKPQTAELKTVDTQDRRPLWLRADVSARIEAKGHLSQWQISLVNITETQTRCRRLERELEKKKLLMRELNHRIANNLMMITSLIMQKEAEVGRSEDLDEIRYQIEAIRYVHEFLQKSEGFEEIDMRGYLKELLNTIFSYFTDKEIDIEKKIDRISLPTQTAIYIGIIVNEAASNAIKYGFNSEQKPRFSVLFEEIEDQHQYLLKLSNSGNPFPEEIDVLHPDSLGLSLIASLSEELNGKLELRRSPSPVFTISFPKEE